MKKLVFILTLLPLVLWAQPGQYFQQRVDYQIDVKIFPEKHQLSAFEKITYHNNSPDTLTFIYFHLWPNAYRKNSDLAKQQAKQGKPKVQFDKQYRGYIDSLDFKVNGRQAKWEYYKRKKDIAIVYLPEPLPPGQSIEITTPFFVKIPKISSRLGYDDKTISITQWYPKPAVYDRYGWHPIPYLNQGEFYSEFGSFDVKITIPSQYVVAATGNLLDTTELNWWKQLQYQSANQVPYPTKKDWKTVRYKQDSVHDFAIFVSNQFKVRSSQVVLPHSKRTVKTYAFFHSDGDWYNATFYVDSAIYYYSLWVGDYPYSVASAVQGALTAGGGMEYPTITVIGMDNNIEQVIVHEVGHNWFYGILAFNERRYPFLDEGINSYYDHRYGRLHNSSLVINGVPTSGIFQKFYEPMVFFGLNQPLDLTSTDYTHLTYGALVYEKTAQALHYLELYLGTENFDKIMQAFYEKWKFKHPYPEDLEQVFDSLAGKPVDWFFDEVIKTNKLIDYKVKGSFRGTLAKNTGQFKAPMPIRYDFVKNTKTRWAMFEPGQSKVYFPVKTKAQVDPDGISLDWYPYNNYTTGKFFGKPLKVSLFPKFFNYEYNHFAITPVPYWRTVDGFLPGLIMNNITLPRRKFQYALGGFYAFDSDVPRFLGYFNYKIPTSNGRPAITFTTYYDNFDVTGNYPRKLAAKIRLDIFNKDASDKFLKSLIVGYFNNTLPGNTRYEFAHSEIYIVKRGSFHPFKAKLFADAGDVNMAGFELSYTPLHYVSLKSGLNIRLFAGWQTPLNAMTPQTDYTLSGTFVTRYNTGFWSNMMVEAYGNFIINSPVYDYATAQNLFVAALNISSSLPLKGLELIRGFANAGFDSNMNMYGEAGLLLDLGTFKVYFPLTATSNLYNGTIRPFSIYRFTFPISDFLDILSQL